jgi:pimeloyl-ACP methyl ester carboxylesterase
MTYTLDGITLEAKRTPSGIGYWQYGADNLPTVVFLHGIGERGDGSESQLMKLISAPSPLSRNCVNNGFNSWTYKEIFSKGMRILLPQLPPSKGIWDIAYIDSFLDAVHTNQPLYLCGFSLGGGGALRYAAQLTKKHKLTCFAGVASAIAPITGENVNCPYFFAHSTNDSTVPVTQTDNYVSKIPNFDSSRYMRGSSGGHWYYVREALNTNILYDWFLSIATPIIEEPIQDIEGKVFKRGDKIVFKFGTEEIILP